MLVVIDERESVGLILVAIVLIRRDPVFYMRIILKLPMPAVSFIVRIICSQLIAQAQVEKDGIPHRIIAGFARKVPPCVRVRKHPVILGNLLAVFFLILNTKILP